MINHNYIDEVISITAGEGIKINVIDKDGNEYNNVEAHRLFPLSRTDEYIALVDNDKNELAIIRNVENLSKENVSVLYDALREYYLIPQILKIYSITEKYGRITFSVKTDHGRCKFEIRNRQTDIKTLFDNRVLIMDASDNRYEISDISELDKKSCKKLLPQL